MIDDELDLRSVNWSQGMFLTPDHFLRQERYVDSLVLWLMRYSSGTHGLVGGGPRVASTELGAARFDPIVEFDDSGDSFRVTVTQCRGVTAGGVPIDVQPSRALQASFSKRDLEGALELGVYVVARPHDKEPDESVIDPVNPQMQLGRRFRYAIRLDVQADEAPISLLLTRVRRGEKGLRFERAFDFIPPCAFMSSHSALMHAFRQLNESVAVLADRYSRLHRAIIDFIATARTHGLSVDQDLETLAFIGRMVVTLDECAYQMLDPVQPPQRFFSQVQRCVRSSAVFLSLSRPTQQYFRELGEVGQAEFVALLQQEIEALEMGRKLAVNEDLGIDVQIAIRAIERLDRLEFALEGKYMDYRVSPSLESVNFMFDNTSGAPVLYKSESRPARPQAHGEELTFVFTGLQLGARESYRVVLVGDRNARFVHGDHVRAEILINRGQGYQQKPQYCESGHEIEGHRNFAIDFDAPSDVVTINDVRVSVRSSQSIRSAILYVRKRMRSEVSEPVPPPLPPRPSPPRPSPVEPNWDRYNRGGDTSDPRAGKKSPRLRRPEE